MEFTNLLTPSVLFFCLGMLAQLIRSDLKLPSDLTKSMAIYLLISIGLHGGQELGHQAWMNSLPALAVAILLGLIMPILAYFILRWLGRQDKFNAIAVATHYGSVSAGTFLTALAFLESHQIAFESYPIMMLAVMETPAILIGLLLVAWIRKHEQQELNQNGFKHVLREAFTNGSILLLLGGMLIGIYATERSMLKVLPFFDQLFFGVLCIFLLSMGMEAGKKLHDFKQAGLFLLTFGILMPILGGLIGLGLAHWLLHFSVGGCMLVAVLGASASYIAVPPVIRMAVPEANPSIYLTLSLGVTFPFNVVIGIPLYYHLATKLLGDF